MSRYFLFFFRVQRQRAQMYVFFSITRNTYNQRGARLAKFWNLLRKRKPNFPKGKALNLPASVQNFNEAIKYQSRCDVHMQFFTFPVIYSSVVIRVTFLLRPCIVQQRHYFQVYFSKHFSYFIPLFYSYLKFCTIYSSRQAMRCQLETETSIIMIDSISKV